MVSQPSMGFSGKRRQQGLAEALLEVGADGLVYQVFTVGKSSAFINVRSSLETFDRCDRRIA